MTAVKRSATHHPATRTTDLLGEAWTTLIIAELFDGPYCVDDLAGVLPMVSRSSLGHRMRRLHAAGLVEATTDRHGRFHYRLTDAGRDLKPVLTELARWGSRWLPPPRAGELDPQVLLTDLCRAIGSPHDPAAIHIRFSDLPGPRQWWVVLGASRARPQRQPPGGLPVLVELECTLTALAGVWLGHSRCLDELRARTLRFTGSRAAVRQVVGWLGARSAVSGETPRIVR
ncbi:winged helix-turn-helix transcriptional regulator [Amycolatopsis magusensis]|uniref:DNA-binding HxlR family transcriptional regulator n=1 Tax=Amycolatopsis magusensis TaxID=882444 RepID=A0ABS4PW30_9PSEU|nr:helix-turn-helix domain-containing protein [Amycolatopsis magusensis]MBP2183634.1 DNA-binding HxlR family transcriptional regulator [Amycolatopsis magusensis]